MTADTTDRLIRFHGQIVPWVSRWSGEVDNRPLEVVRSMSTGALAFVYEDSPDPERDPHRDANGVLWSRDGQDRSGRPEFGQVNALRQRACMLERRCQVCGDSIADTPIHWLMGPQHLSVVAGRYVTMSPPTCRSCAELSRTLCPHLSRNGNRLLLVEQYELWGVYGEAVWLEAGRMQSNPHAAASFARPEHPLSGMLAKQLLVELTRFTEAEPESRP